MTKLTITWLGQPKEIQTKFGTKQKNAIKAAEYGDSFLSFWLSPMTKDWKVGDVVEVDNVTTREYQGKTYHDIQMPRHNGTNPELAKKLEEIISNQTRIKLALTELVLWKRHQTGEDKPKIAGTNIDYPTEPRPEDVPF